MLADGGMPDDVAGLRALSGLRCLAQLDLTCCRKVDDQEAQQVGG